MTVKELIEKLKEFDGELEVSLEAQNWQLLFKVNTAYQIENEVVISFYNSP